MEGYRAVPEMEKILAAGASCLLTVTGSSMVPFLHHGKDAVVLAKPGKEGLKPGQILFFRRGNRTYILHRLRRVEKDGSLLICGDAQTWMERIQRSQIIGVVVAVQRPDGRIVSCDSFSWRLRSALWYPTRPFRPLLFRIWAAGRKISAFWGKRRRE